jgi:hypothetical protein
MSDLETRRDAVAARMRQMMARVDARMQSRIDDGTWPAESSTDRVYRRCDWLARETAYHANGTASEPELAAIALAHATMHDEIETAYLQDLDAERASRAQDRSGGGAS